MGTRDILAAHDEPGWKDVLKCIKDTWLTYIEVPGLHSSKRYGTIQLSLLALRRKARLQGVIASKGLTNRYLRPISVHERLMTKTKSHLSNITSELDLLRNEEILTLDILNTTQENFTK